MRLKSLALSVLLLATSSILSAEDLIPRGLDQLANDYVTGHQQYPQVASLGDGGFVVIWEGGLQEGVYGVGMKIFGSDFEPLPGGDIQVNTSVAIPQSDPQVASLSDGSGFVVVWTHREASGGPTQVFGQLFDNLGSFVGSELDLTENAPASQSKQALYPTDDGFLLVLKDFEDGIVGRHFFANGAPAAGRFLVSETTDPTDNPDVAVTAGGNVIITWQQNELSVPGDYDTYGRCYNLDNESVGPAPINDSDDFNGEPAVDVVGENALVAFPMSNGDSVRDIATQFVFGFGSQCNLVNDPSIINSEVAGDQRYPDIACDSEGCVAVWHSDTTPTGEDTDCSQVQRDCTIATQVAPDGDPVGDNFEIHSHKVGHQRWPQVATNGECTAFVWQTQSFPGGAGEDIAVRFYCGSMIFSDGFESGDLSAWDDSDP